MKRRRSMLVLGLLAASLLSRGAAAAAPETIAVFDFTLDNTSLEPSSAAELARTARISAAFAAALGKSGAYTLVDMGQAAALLKGQSDIRACNGCERPVAMQLGAHRAAYGWVQKVSNLILNLNVVIEDPATGRTVTGGSVDIRGNNDESWDRGLKFLLEEHVFQQ